MVAIGGVGLVVLSALFQAGYCAECHGHPKPGAKPNLIPFATGKPKLVKTTTNGKLFTVGEGDDVIKVAHVYGTPYEMGYAHGELLKDEAKSMIDRVWTYMEDQIVGKAKKDLKWMAWFLDDVATLGLDLALGLELDLTRPYTKPEFFDEVRGLADATGANYKRILYIHMIGELTKGACSMIGAWGNSVSNESALIQLRALDWAVDGPFKDFPQVTVYHPVNSTYGRPWANFGWTGWVGSITGMNSQKMAISEIGVAFPDETFGKESRFGIPFTNILRDLLQYDATLQAATHRITNAKRTCDLILGVGDGKSKEFRGIEYSASVANFMDDKHLEPIADWHPRIKDVVYYGMDWLCPPFSEVLAKQIQTYYGGLNVTTIMRHVVSIVTTGNMQVAVYDLDNNVAFLANARGTNETGPEFAYDRQFVRMNMTELFSESHP